MAWDSSSSCEKRRKHLIDPYLTGERLYGDDFDLAQIEEWFEGEREGYANLVSHRRKEYRYAYHALNWIHGFKYLPHREFDHALGFGSARGDEFEPIAHLLHRVTILETSEQFRRSTVHGVPVIHETPATDGSMSYQDDFFDLITCLGVLHHIPNVTRVVSELYRCLRPEGFMLLREPIVSMGDWRRPRRGLTKQERGIPLPLLEKIIVEAGFIVVNRALCVFPPVPRLWKAFGREAFNSRFATRLDSVLSQAFKWNLRYHPRSLIEKLRPTCSFYVLSK